MQYSDLNNNVAEHLLKTSHTIDWDSAASVTYRTDYYQQITLESWFINLEQTALNRCQPLPAPYRIDCSTGNSNTLFIIHVTTHLFAIPISTYVFTAKHITRLPTATLSIDQSNRLPGVLNFQLTKTIT